MKINNKPILLRDVRAVRLVKKRARAENRSAANAAAQSIIEWFEQKEVKPKKQGR